MLDTVFQIAVIITDDAVRQEALSYLGTAKQQKFSILNFSTYRDFIDSGMESYVCALVVSHDVLYGSGLNDQKNTNSSYAPVICLELESDAALCSQPSVWRTFSETIKCADLTPALLCHSLRHLIELSSVVGEMKNLQKSAEVADRANNRLFEYMSHELTSPLQSAKILQESIAHLDDMSLIKDNARVTAIAVTHVLDTVNNMAEYIRASKNLIEMQKEEFSVIPVIEDLMDLFHPHAINKNITISFEYFSQEDCMYTGDRARIRQVLVNILKNSIKYTDQGSVKIRACRGDDSLCISVSDTGIGMTPGQVEEVLARNSLQPSVEFDGGLGVGLRLSREILDLVGGYLTVQSKKGQGSNFTVVLPNEKFLSRKKETLAMGELVC